MTNILFTVTFAVAIIVCGLLIRRLFPQAQKILPRARMGSNRAHFLLLFFMVAYLLIYAFGIHAIFYHIHLSALAIKLNISYANLDLMITILTSFIGVAGQIIVVFLFFGNLPMLPREESGSMSPFDNTWPPAPHTGTMEK